MLVKFIWHVMSFMICGWTGGESQRKMKRPEVGIETTRVGSLSKRWREELYCKAIPPIEDGDGVG